MEINNRFVSWKDAVIVLVSTAAILGQLIALISREQATPAIIQAEITGKNIEGINHRIKEISDDVNLIRIQAMTKEEAQREFASIRREIDDLRDRIRRSEERGRKAQLNVDGVAEATDHTPAH